MSTREKSAPALPPMFPSMRRKYVRVPPAYAYKYLIHILTEDLGLKNTEIKHLVDLALGASLGGRFGATLKVHITREGDISVLNIRFGYEKIIVLAASLFIAAVLVSFSLGTSWPMLGVAILLPLAYEANMEAVNFLGVLNETLPFLEQEYARQALLKDRERWRKHKGNVKELYEKLRRKHIETWGDTKVLKYKIEEYQSMGLTYEEAIIKIAEEEGIITD